MSWANQPPLCSAQYFLPNRAVANKRAWLVAIWLQCGSPIQITFCQQINNHATSIMSYFFKALVGTCTYTHLSLSLFVTLDQKEINTRPIGNQQTIEYCIYIYTYTWPIIAYIYIHMAIFHTSCCSNSTPRPLHDICWCWVAMDRVHALACHAMPWHAMPCLTI